MKVVIFAGGLGTRLSEETDVRPKPMVEIDGHPILWHIMKIYSHYGLNDFVICCGYKGHMIKDYFANYFTRTSDVSFDFRNGESTTTYHRPPREKWRVTLVDTGLKTQTGGRIQRVKDYVGDEDFCLTYGDGLADVDISKLIEFHKSHNKVATVTAVQPAGRFGSLDIQNETVNHFIEKPLGDGGWINGGFFVLSPKVFDFIPQKADEIMWEDDPMRNLADSGNLKAFKHTGFWHAMDTLREKNKLEQMCVENEAPWMAWHPARQGKKLKSA